MNARDRLVALAEQWLDSGQFPRDLLLAHSLFFTHFQRRMNWPQFLNLCAFVKLRSDVVHHQVAPETVIGDLDAHRAGGDAYDVARDVLEQEIDDAADVLLDNRKAA